VGLVLRCAAPPPPFGKPPAASFRGGAVALPCFTSRVLDSEKGLLTGDPRAEGCAALLPARGGASPSVAPPPPPSPAGASVLGGSLASRCRTIVAAAEATSCCGDASSAARTRANASELTRPEEGSRSRAARAAARAGSIMAIACSSEARGPATAEAEAGTGGREARTEASLGEGNCSVAAAKHGPPDLDVR
jgi:hypothetical protein